MQRHWGGANHKPWELEAKDNFQHVDLVSESMNYVQAL
jgi:hypothetical protein